jgi:hypothetical protein
MQPLARIPRLNKSINLKKVEGISEKHTQIKSLVIFSRYPKKTVLLLKIEEMMGGFETGWRCVSG